VPTTVELAAIVLEPIDVERVEREAALIADPEMQTVVRRLLTNERKRAAWRRAQGYRECTRCGALHSEPDEVCPACRSEAGR
jgi:rubrerythrin